MNMDLCGVWLYFLFLFLFLFQFATLLEAMTTV